MTSEDVKALVELAGEGGGRDEFRQVVARFPVAFAAFVLMVGVVVAAPALRADRQVESSAG